MKTRDLVIIAVFTALMCVLAPLSIPLTGQVPISLATLVVMLMGVVLGAKKSSIAVCLYIIIAIIGVPVLAGYRSGVSAVFGPTGGYIWGYIPLAYMSGALSNKFEGKKDIIYTVLGMLIGTVILYTLGTIWYIYFTKTKVLAAILACVTPFIPGDIVKMIVVILLGPRLRNILNKVN